MRMAMLLLILTIFSFIIILIATNHLIRKSVLSWGERGAGIRYNSDVRINNLFARGNATGSLISLKEFNRLAREFEGRRKRVESQCRSTGQEEEFQLNESFLSNMIIDLKHDVSWCPIYKAASSIWMKNFAVLGESLTGPVIDLIERKVIEIRTVARRAFPHSKLHEIQEKFNKTKKFVIVRHPLERLVSAYRDKIESKTGRKYYYEKYGRHIARKYGKTVGRNESGHESVPTFAEFLEFIVNEKRFDEHWRPFYAACHPCVIKYDYILKLETYNVDQSFLLQDTGLSQYLYDNDDFRNVNPLGRTNRALVSQYIGRVPRTILKQISKIYEKDFELFSYSLDYLN